ncbi:MAG: glycosyltransferase, partial [Bacteroidota bacterium]
ARRLGVARDIRFLGKQEPVEEILSIADVFLIPSGSESFGLAALEAMACRVPVVSSNIGGLPELNVHGETGFLCDFGDVGALTDATRTLLLDEELHERMAANARRRAEDEFDIHRIVPRYEAFYDSVAQAEVGV